VSALILQSVRPVTVRQTNSLANATSAGTIDGWTMSDTDSPVDDLRKQSYSSVLERTGYFCSICKREVRNASGLVYFKSDETVRSLKVCHDCLPENFE